MDGRKRKHDDFARQNSSFHGRIAGGARRDPGCGFADGFDSRPPLRTPQRRGVADGFGASIVSRRACDVPQNIAHPAPWRQRDNGNAHGFGSHHRGVESQVARSRRSGKMSEQRRKTHGADIRGSIRSSLNLCGSWKASHRSCKRTLSNAPARSFAHCIIEGTETQPEPSENTGKVLQAAIRLGNFLAQSMAAETPGETVSELEQSLEAENSEEEYDPFGDASLAASAPADSFLENGIETELPTEIFERQSVQTETMLRDLSAALDDLRDVPTGCTSPFTCDDIGDSFTWSPPAVTGSAGPPIATGSFEPETEIEYSRSPAPSSPQEMPHMLSRSMARTPPGSPPPLSPRSPSEAFDDEFNDAKLRDVKSDLAGWPFPSMPAEDNEKNNLDKVGGDGTATKEEEEERQESKVAVAAEPVAPFVGVAAAVVTAPAEALLQSPNVSRASCRVKVEPETGVDEVTTRYAEEFLVAKASAFGEEFVLEISQWDSESERRGVQRRVLSAMLQPLINATSPMAVKNLLVAAITRS